MIGQAQADAILELGGGGAGEGDDQDLAHRDVVLGHHANLSAVATANVARRAGKPYALFLHGTGIEPRHQGLYDDRLWALIEEAIRGAALRKVVRR